jgi:hypothetical protein
MLAVENPPILRGCVTLCKMINHLLLDSRDPGGRGAVLGVKSGVLAEKLKNRKWNEELVRFLQPSRQTLPMRVLASLEFVVQVFLDRRIYRVSFEELQIASL